MKKVIIKSISLLLATALLVSTVPASALTEISRSLDDGHKHSSDCNHSEVISRNQQNDNSDNTNSEPWELPDDVYELIEVADYCHLMPYVNALTGNLIVTVDIFDEVQLIYNHQNGGWRFDADEYLDVWDECIYINSLGKVYPVIATDDVWVDGWSIDTGEAVLTITGVYGEDELLLEHF